MSGRLTNRIKNLGRKQRQLLPLIGLTGIVIVIAVTVSMLAGSRDDKSIGAEVLEATPAWRDDITLLEKSINFHVNMYRQGFGLYDLEYRDEISDISRGHSYYQSVIGNIDHKGRNETSVDDRFRNTSYLCGENVLMRPRARSESRLYGLFTTSRVGDILNMSTDALAAELVSLWIESTGHEENMRGQHYRFGGVGIHYDEDGEQLYVTHNLCLMKIGRSSIRP
ncbi:MAG: CAP domain-containing protein [SAR202 cluster bacterium]|nr:CAP domain-containing protein [SAR202 cluster bacterium]